MSTSCQVCFEDFSTDSEGTQPRRLKCSHIVCTSCIMNDLFDSTYYCPECMCELNGEIDDISSPTTVEEIVIAASDSFEESQQQSHDSNDDGHQALTTKNSMYGRDSEIRLTLRASQHDRGKIDQIANDIKNASFNFKIQESRLEAIAKKELTPDDLKTRFREQKRIELGEAMDLIDRAKAIMIREENVLRLEAPLLAVGDIHGQFFDLLNLIEEGGSPGDSEQYLFLGDYVDRGSFSCEVMLYLIALKIQYPDKIWLLRGNHECAAVSGHFGFKQECKIKYGMNLYYRFLLLFQTMPLAAVIMTAYGEIFACHGGISPAFETIDDIQKIHRFIEPETDGSLLDILWSDPVTEENCDTMDDDEYEAFMNIDWKPNPSRGCSYTYGYKALRAFLDRNNLVCLVRAHEVQEDGYKKHFDPSVVEARIKSLIETRQRNLEYDMIEDEDGVTPVPEIQIDIGESDFPPLLTIFSAPNYCDRYQNKAAILKIDIGLDGFHAIQYECVPHPEPEIGESQTDNYMLAIISACPYMPTSLRSFVQHAVELGYDMDFEEEEEEIEEDDMDEGIDRQGGEEGEGEGYLDRDPENVQPDEGDIDSDDNDDDDDIDGNEEVNRYTESEPTDGTTTRHMSTLLPLSEDDTIIKEGEREGNSPASLSLLNPDDVIPSKKEKEENLSLDIISATTTATAINNTTTITTAGYDLDSASIAKSSPMRGPLHPPTVSLHYQSTPKYIAPFNYVITNNKHTGEDYIPPPPKTLTSTPASNSSSGNIITSNHSSTNALNSLAGGATNTSLTPPKSRSGTRELKDQTSEKHQAYIESLLSDSINEIHPYKVTSSLNSLLPSQEIVLQGHYHVKPGQLISSIVAAIKSSLQVPSSSSSSSSTAGGPRSHKSTTYPRKSLTHKQRALNSNLLSHSGELIPLPSSRRMYGDGDNYVSYHSPGHPHTTNSSTNNRWEYSHRKDGMIATAVNSALTTNTSAAIGVTSANNSVYTSYDNSPEFNEKTKRILNKLSQKPHNTIHLTNESTGPTTNVAYDSKHNILKILTKNEIEKLNNTLSSSSSVTTPEVDIHPGWDEINQLAYYKGLLPSVHMYNRNEDMKDEEEDGINLDEDGCSSNNNNMIDESPDSNTDKDFNTDSEYISDHTSTYDMNSRATSRATSFNSTPTQFDQKEILGLKLMFSLFDRSGSNIITHDDLIAYGEETDDLSAIRDADRALRIVDMDGDGKIGLEDFIRFAFRLKARWLENHMYNNSDNDENDDMDNEGVGEGGEEEEIVGEICDDDFEDRADLADDEEDDEEVEDEDEGGYRGEPHLPYKQQQQSDDVEREEEEEEEDELTDHELLLHDDEFS